MSMNDIISGYLDVKISSKSRRGLTPWKAWQKQWCEIRRLDTIENGVELKLKSDKEGSVLNCVILPRSSTICRTESRTKQYSFGVFNLGRTKKPIMFMSGSSESDSQEWMSSIRRMLSIASYIPVGDSNFRVSLIDNNHSRMAGLIGLFGVLGVNTQGVMVSDPCTGELKVRWKWFQFHQFHLQAPVQPVDDKKIIVMHSSGEFPSGPGHLYLYCKEGPKLLHHLIARGKLSKKLPGIIASKRLSRSESDLYCPKLNSCGPDSPLCFRSQTGSEDSGVRVSESSDDSGYALSNSKNIPCAQNIGMALITKTPGGSETEDSSRELTDIDEEARCLLPRNKSGISLASGIYEEIPDEPKKSPKNKDTKYTSHIYENPLEVILDIKSSEYFKPPPLPPRRLEFSPDTEEKQHSTFFNSVIFSPFKHRCNTLPAKDLSKISQIFNADSEYVVMSPSKTLEKPRKQSITENMYMPMSPVINLKNKLVESYYISMNGKRT
ncbi:uncharacterized protein LOC108916816 [Anoplophora glabripennis]|uniref:uncharacterized protein LOC108916816 n=1 Tax=Anoplophora glabripennis TaxID=217634 RepID=UPI0008756514|nr:uncharacterized protein LOC108916816 [Anoplophora glabripennis]XP_018578636.1 uncharacterized protein LOC108916816 [Anoplophora glabripennis]